MNLVISSFSVFLGNGVRPEYKTNVKSIWFVRNYCQLIVKILGQSWLKKKKIIISLDRTNFVRNLGTYTI
jgi:hypothetical protein